MSKLLSSLIEMWLLFLSDDVGGLRIFLGDQNSPSKFNDETNIWTIYDILDEGDFDK